MILKFVKDHYQEHDQVECAIEQHHKQAHLYFFEESISCLDVDID